MAKRNVMYIKPDEPSFLKRLKTEAGYKEGTTVQTKFETLPTGPEDLSDNESEEPQIVILAPGDLSKEEVDVQKKKISEEIESKPADLNERVIFKPRPKNPSEEGNFDKRKSKKPMKAKITLSFDDDDDIYDDTAFASCEINNPQNPSHRVYQAWANYSLLAM